MKTLFETLRDEVRSDVIFSTVHARFRELNDTLPRHNDEIFFFSAKPEEIEDLALIMLFFRKLTLFQHPMYEKVEQACTCVLKRGMHSLDFKQLFMADRLADIVMHPPTMGLTIGRNAA